MIRGWEIGTRVMRVARSTFDHEITSISVGKIAKYHKNGNFIIHWDGEDKPDPQQYRASEVSSRASATGSSHSSVDLFTPEGYDKAKAEYRRDSSCRAIRTLCWEIGRLDLRSISADAIFEAATQIKTAAQALGVRKKE